MVTFESSHKLGTCTNSPSRRLEAASGVSASTGPASVSAFVPQHSFS